MQPPAAELLADFCKQETAQREITPELKEILEVVAVTGSIWHDWLHLKQLLDVRMTQVLQEFNGMRASVEVGPPRPLLTGETFQELLARLRRSLESFFEGPPFTLQRLCEVLLNPQQTYANLDKVALALEKLLLVTSTLGPSKEPYPSLPLPTHQVEVIYRPPRRPSSDHRATPGLDRMFSPEEVTGPDRSTEGANGPHVAPQQEHTQHPGGSQPMHVDLPGGLLAGGADAGPASDAHPPFADHVPHEAGPAATGTQLLPGGHPAAETAGVELLAMVMANPLDAGHEGTRFAHAQLNVQDVNTEPFPGPWGGNAGGGGSGSPMHQPANHPEARSQPNSDEHVEDPPTPPGGSEPRATRLSDKQLLDLYEAEQQQQQQPQQPPSGGGAVSSHEGTTAAAAAPADGGTHQNAEGVPESEGRAADVEDASREAPNKAQEPREPLPEAGNERTEGSGPVILQGDVQMGDASQGQVAHEPSHESPATAAGVGGAEARPAETGEDGSSVSTGAATGTVSSVQNANSPIAQPQSHLQGSMVSSEKLSKSQLSAGDNGAGGAEGIQAPCLPSPSPLLQESHASEHGEDASEK
eukprot:jgi/Mesen1/612/ME000108S10763